MSEPMVIDAVFPLAGKSLPLDHGYPLFSALSRALPELHGRATWAVHPVLGRRAGPGVLELIDRSALKLRLPVEDLREVLPLVGQTLDVGGHRVVVGAPQIRPLEGRPRLKARFVTIKHHAGSELDFAAAAKEQLCALGDLGQSPPSIEVLVGPRRVMRVGAQVIVGFPMILAGLLGAASLRIQQRGLGGRRHMGAGIFVPVAKARA